jgi:tetratricopeptide (TPR) repeat protein
MYAEAAKHYNKALAMTKDDENLWFNLGRALFEGGNAKMAATALRKALELNPDFVEARALLHNLENGGS